MLRRRPSGQKAMGERRQIGRQTGQDKHQQVGQFVCSSSSDAQSCPSAASQRKSSRPPIGPQLQWKARTESSPLARLSLATRRPFLQPNFRPRTVEESRAKPVTVCGPTAGQRGRPLGPTWPHTVAGALCLLKLGARGNIFLSLAWAAPKLSRPASWRPASSMRRKRRLSCLSCPSLATLAARRLQIPARRRQSAAKSALDAQLGPLHVAPRG